MPSDEFESDFEDEEYEEEDDIDEDFEEEADFPEDVQRALREQPDSRLTTFLEDPWPLTAFILIIAGFAIILPWPEAIWFVAVYYLLALYLLSVLGIVAIVFSLKAWLASDTKLRFIAATFVIISLVCLVVGFIDTIAWAMTGYSVIPELQTPLVVLLIVIEIFIIYSLWIMRSQFMKPEE